MASALSLRNLERLSDRMVPGKRRGRVGDWILRSDRGVTGRANSCWAQGQTDRDFGDDLRSVERWYDNQNLTAQFQVFDGNEPLSAALLDRGYLARPGATVMSARRIRAAASPDVRITVSHTVPAGLIDLVGDADRVVECTRSRGSVVAVTCEVDGLTVGGGVVAVDGVTAGIGMMHTHRSHRRKGIAKAMLSQLAREATSRGARHFWLQVTPANVGAISLYESVGFVSRHGYSYAVFPGLPHSEVC